MQESVERLVSLLLFCIDVEASTCMSSHRQKKRKDEELRLLLPHALERDVCDPNEQGVSANAKLNMSASASQASIPSLNYVLQ